MIKKIGLITAALAAGAFLTGGIASADTPATTDSTVMTSAVRSGCST
jgi:hypothetical protein